MTDEKHTQSIDDTGLIALAQAHYLPQSTGSKAARLGMLIEAGYNVPDGFVITARITNQRCAQPGKSLLNPSDTKALDKLWKRLATKRVAVRSSSASEDREESSFAGVYETTLNINRDNLESAVSRVYRSLISDHSDVYRHSPLQHNDVTHSGQGGVIVQKMVPAEYSGVMFTEHPNTSRAMMVEMVAGLGGDQMDGNVTPDSYAFGKLTGELLTDESSAIGPAPIALDSLLALGRELEKLFGQPQDIEWAYAKGKFYLLQARDITRSISNGKSLKHLAEQERSKLLKNLLGERDQLRQSDQIDPSEPVYVLSELCELLPRPTPLSADLMERIWSTGGSMHLACQHLGIPYNVHARSMPYVNTIFGWTYVNRHEEKRRLGKGPSTMATFKLSRSAKSTQAHFRDQFLPALIAEMATRDAMAIEQMTLETAIHLLHVWVERFVTHTYCAAQRINISADIHMTAATDKLKAAGLDPATYFAHKEDTVVSRAMALLNRENISAEAIEEFLQSFGHRAPIDHELAEPRFEEDLSLVRQYIERSTADNREQQLDDIAPQPFSKALKTSVQQAREFIQLKEEARHYCMMELAQIRRLLIAIDSQLQLDGRVFQLSIDEVTQLANATVRPRLLRLADERFEASMTWKSVRPPASLSIHDLERIDMLTGTRPDTAEQGDLCGKHVAGSSEVFGTVRVITDIDQIHTFTHGEILVAEVADSSWYPLFAQARGIITEVGGWLSHTAIIAREYDLPAIVGVSGACQKLKNGDLVRMSLSGSIDLVTERRSSGRHPPRAHSDTFKDSITEAVDGRECEPVDMYHLTAHKLSSHRQSIERRAMKQRISDRRQQPRYNERGELLEDRRLSNRTAYHEKLRKAG